MVDALRPAVFLDRDGVLNRSIVRDGKPYPPQTLDELELMPGAVEAVQDLKQAGFVTVIVTNQPDVAKGTQTRDVVDAINAHVMTETGIDHLYVCWCIEGDDCDCYKPKPGMLLDAARDHDLDLPKSFMVGDRWRDVGAGINAGCTSVLVDCNYAEPMCYDPTHVVEDISGAVRCILGSLELETNKNE